MVIYGVLYMDLKYIVKNSVIFLMVFLIMGLFLVGVFAETDPSSVNEVVTAESTTATVATEESTTQTPTEQTSATESQSTQSTTKETETETKETTERETEKTTETSSKTTYATTQTTTYSLPPAEVETFPTAVVVPEKTQKGDLTYGIVSWICVIVGVIVIVVVLISNKTQYRSGSGKHRYSEGNKITGQKRLLNDEYYNNRKTESYYSKDKRR